MMTRTTPMLLALLLACNGDDGTAEGSATGSTSNGSTSSTSASSESTSSGDASSSSTSTTTGGTTSTSGETTDATTGGTTGGSNADAFRFTKLYVRDPHFYIVPIIGCEDITDKDLLAVKSVNAQFNDAINNDASMPMDGFLDMNFMLLFRPLDQGGAGGDFDFATGQCTAPIGTTSCDVKMGTMPSPSTYANMAGNCLDPNPGELSSEMYSPQPGSTTGPCFAGGPLSFTLDLGDFQLAFADATIAAKYVGDPASGMVEGNIHGFISETVADSTTLPMDIPVLGGKPISELLPGGKNNCAKHDDRDLNGDVSGWWFYIEFEAARVPYTGP
ncbi:MAG TPA: hypothetical protein PKW35_07135 [Nannocystaceae bacterium]|nr:hypothetical protein [Nannocystaceae bacterium]